MTVAASFSASTVSTPLKVSTPPSVGEGAGNSSAFAQLLQHNTSPCPSSPSPSHPSPRPSSPSPSHPSPKSATTSEKLTAEAGAPEASQLSSSSHSVSEESANDPPAADSNALIQTLAAWPTLPAHVASLSLPSEGAGDTSRSVAGSLSIEATPTVADSSFASPSLDPLSALLKPADSTSTSAGDELLSLTDNGETSLSPFNCPAVFSPSISEATEVDPSLLLSSRPLNTPSSTESSIPLTPAALLAQRATPSITDPTLSGSSSSPTGGERWPLPLSPERPLQWQSQGSSGAAKQLEALSAGSPSPLFPVPHPHPEASSLLLNKAPAADLSAAPLSFSASSLSHPDLSSPESLSSSPFDANSFLHEENLPSSSFPSAAALHPLSPPPTSAPISANDVAVATLATPASQTSQWAVEAAEKIIWYAGHALQKVELQLTPPNLGKLEVTLQLANDQLTAHFIAATPAARDLLNDALPRLRELLAQAGVQLGHTSVSTGGGSTSDQKGFRDRDSNPPASSLAGGGTEIGGSLERQPEARKGSSATLLETWA
ncbi:MAG: flagellar hook-length control protein FliK [Hydrogenophilus sp.]|nr:flagellar hook-length control protein FliK [Hydrogenophilus sp.]